MELNINITDIMEKTKNGQALSDAEIGFLREHVNLEKASNQSFDFGEMEAKSNGGSIERDALIERNARWAKAGPTRPDGKSWDEVCDKSPKFTGPFVAVTPEDQQRARERFRLRMEESRVARRVV